MINIDIDTDTYENDANYTHNAMIIGWSQA